MDIQQEKEDFKQSSIYKGIKMLIQGIKYLESQEWNLAHEQFKLATETQYYESAYFLLRWTSILLGNIISARECEEFLCFQKPQQLLKIINDLRLTINEDNNIILKCSKICAEVYFKSIEDSRAAFEQVVQQFPNHILSHFHLGNFNFKANNNLKAIENFNKAIALCPSFPILYHNKGRCLHQLGKYEEALDCFNQALAIQKNHDLSYFGKLQALLSLEKNIEGLSFCDFILQFDNQNELVYENKGVNFQKLGDFRNALICYRIIKSLNQYNDSLLDPEQLQQNL